MEQEEEQDAFQAFGEEVELPEIIPDFEKEDIDEPQYLTGAMRGTAYHRIFELLDMELEEYNQETVKKMIDGFVDAGLIDRMGAASVMRKDIIDFTKSDLFRRMKKAYANNQLYREQHFLMGVPACEINSNTTSKETMIIQGIIDLCFVENDKYVIVDYKTDKVLMVAYMNEEAFNLTIKTGKMTYFSRSRNEIWVKGVTSGHFQYVKELSMDCDLDTMLAKVYQVGVPCHTGADTCFFNTLVKKEYDESNPMRVFEDVYNVILDRKKNPKEGSYTNYLFDKGIDKILKKVGEEATEIVIAAKNPDPQEVKYEISDFLYHVMVLMAEKGVSWKEITKELSRR